MSSTAVAIQIATTTPLERPPFLIYRPAQRLGEVGGEDADQKREDAGQVTPDQADAQGEVLGDTIEGYAGQQGEARRSPP
jgi:hypothetical protein